MGPCWSRVGEGDDTSSTEADSTSGGSPCESVDTPAPKKDADLPAPKADEPTAAGVTFETSCGSFTVTFDDRAPKTAASMQYLARRASTTTPSSTGSSPASSSRAATRRLRPGEGGTGGPGYHVDEKPPADLSYTKGIVAMAKSQVEPPGRSGSQFYVVTGADAGLPPDYALAGKVTEGMDTVEAIDALGTPGADGPPTQTVVINRRHRRAEDGQGERGADRSRLHASLDRRGRVLLADHRGSWVVLAFYPGDFTPTCTKQFCNYRDGREKIDDLDAEVVGISPQDVESHERFIAEHSLTVPLAADVDKSVAAQPTASSRRAAPSCAGRSSSSTRRA